MLTDLLNGYAHYAPGTLVIKGCMAMAAALLAKAMGNKACGLRRQRRGGQRSSWWRATSAMPALLLGKGIGAAASIPGNLVQAAMGLVIGLVLFCPAQAQQGTGQTGSAVIHCAYEQAGRGEAPVGRCFVG